MNLKKYIYSSNKNISHPDEQQLNKMGQTSSNNSSSSYPNNTSTASSSAARRRSFRSPFVRRKKHKNLLSATFQVPCSTNFEALNINTATVEQFMTLPNITRRIAQSIVDHRVALGGRFQRVDDLALVSGIGAVKLEQIRPEICVKRMTSRSIQGSSISSRTPSLDSIYSDQHFQNAQKTIVNVNTSTVFQLQQVHGMNQELAASLVEYRSRKGPFKSLDDLVKVKGLSHVRLGAIRSSLCVNDEDIPKTPKFTHANLTQYASAVTSTPLKNGYTNVSHRKSMSMPTKMSLSLANGFSNAPVNDIFDLLGAYSHRPIVEDNYNNTRNGHSSIRLASWNLDKMCAEKSANLGVKEVICRTILENRLSILCLQEVLEPDALQNICDELNHPSLRRIIEWKENSRNWKWFVNRATAKTGALNGLGFIYNADRCDAVREDCFDIPLESCCDDWTRGLPTAPTSCLAAFKLSDWTCYILNTYLRYFNLENISKVINAIDQTLAESNHLKISDIFFVAGDFSGTDLDLMLSSVAPMKYLLSASSTMADSRKSLQRSRKMVDINLENLGFFGMFESHSTSYIRNNEPCQINDGTTIVSSSNILCRENIPSTRSAFQEALYNSATILNSPSELYDKLIEHHQKQVPSTKTSATTRDTETNTTKLCGYSGIIRQGLCHMAIPKGWSWGGPASEHCPVWIEMYKRINRLTQPKIHHQSLDLVDNELHISTINNNRRNSYTTTTTMSNSKSNGHILKNSVVALSTAASHKKSKSNGNLLNVSSDSVFLSKENSINV